MVRDRNVVMVTSLEAATEQHWGARFVGEAFDGVNDVRLTSRSGRSRHIDASHPQLPFQLTTNIFLWKQKMIIALVPRKKT